MLVQESIPNLTIRTTPTSAIGRPRQQNVGMTVRKLRIHPVHAGIGCAILARADRVRPPRRGGSAGAERRRPQNATRAPAWRRSTKSTAASRCPIRSSSLRGVDLLPYTSILDETPRRPSRPRFNGRPRRASDSGAADHWRC
jgi:hypothetical protein